MVDIFLSYSSADRFTARRIAKFLEDSGWSVWMDRFIKGGTAWHPELQAQLRSARCVVVLWTRDSVASDWVVAEARAARERQVLLPVKLHPVTPPDELAEVQCTQVTAWIDESNSFELQPLVDRVASFLGTIPKKLPDERISTTNLLITRVEVAEAVFRFCAARLTFFHERKSQQVASPEALAALRSTYKDFEKVLAPVTSDELHELIDKHKRAYTPQDEADA
jgi:TIR domain